MTHPRQGGTLYRREISEHGGRSLRKTLDENPENLPRAQLEQSQPDQSAKGIHLSEGFHAPLKLALSPTWLAKEEWKIRRYAQ